MRLFAAKSPTVIEFVLIEEGAWHESKRGPNGNQVYMTADQVRASVSLFSGLPVQAIDRKPNFFDHMPNQAKNELSAEGARFLLKDVVGFIREPRAETLPSGKLAVVAPIHFHDERVANTLRAAVEGGDYGFTGGSIDGQPQRWENKLIDGTPYDTVWLGNLDTWDLATFPAAGGRMLRLAASRSIQNIGETTMKLTAKQIAILNGLLFAAGVKSDALEKLYADGVDFGKESLTAIRAALAGKDDLLKQFDVLAAKIEKGEDLDNTFKSLSELKFEDKKLEADAAAKAAVDAQAKVDADAKAKADLDAAKLSEDATVKQAAALLEQAKAANEAVDTKLGEIEIESRVNASRLPDKAKAKLKETLKLRKEYDGNRINASIDAEARYVSEISGNRYVEGGRLNASFEMGDNEVDNLLLRTEAMLSQRPVFNDKKQRIEPLRSFSELHRLTASADEKYDPEKFFRKLARGLNGGFEASNIVDLESGRITASLTTSDLAEIYGTAMHRSMQKDYNLSDFNVWRKIAQVESLSDLRTHYYARFGGYAAAPVISEGGTYTEATSPGDEQVSLTIYKYGHIESITEEMIINDDLRAVQRITKQLGVGMAIDLYRMVFDPITNNDAVSYGSDTDTLVHANHANGAASSGSALSDSTFKTGYDAMIAQSAYGDTRAYLNNKPRYIICGYKQARTAELIANPMVLAQFASGSSSFPEATFLPNSGLPNPLGLADGAVISLPHITSTTNWWMVADPMDLPVILVGFHNGKDTPELVTEAAGTGSHFTADKIRMKTKMRRGAVLNEHRAIYGQIA